tara:strand:- start:353 stop:1318 length:966 start_codon:yes stop_codon:yes gene_type:complete
VSNVQISSPFVLNFEKNTVIDNGFKTSFFNLLTMITTSGDRDKVKNTPIKEIKSMIDSFTISEEKFINNEYFANLETFFDKKKVLRFIERKNIFPSIPLRKKVLLIPILIDVQTDSVYFFDDNIFYETWNHEKNNFQLLEYLLPSEDLGDLNKIQNVKSDIETHDFSELIKKYDLKDYIVLIMYKNKSEIKILSKIALNNSLILNNKKYAKIDLKNKNEVQKLIVELRNIYEDEWKKNNEINTSIKLPLTISVKSKDYKNIMDLEKVLISNDLISHFYILNFNNKRTQYRVIYNGSPQIFFNDMTSKNFNLILENNVWIIK